MEGKREGATIGGERERGGAAIDGGEELAGVTESGSTKLGFQFGEHRDDAEVMVSPTERATLAGKVLRGARHGRQRGKLARVNG
jgi:hypothetical protein